jgi:hypothetical protein
LQTSGYLRLAAHTLQTWLVYRGYCVLLHTLREQTKSNPWHEKLTHRHILTIEQFCSLIRQRILSPCVIKDDRLLSSRKHGDQRTVSFWATTAH